VKAQAALADAKNARAAYGEYKPAEGWNIVDPSKFGLDPAKFSNNETGFGALVLQNAKTGALEVSFRGSDRALNDWIGNNFPQGLGLGSAQYQAAIEIATSLSFTARDRGIDLSFTGLSLGGGLAAAAAMASYGVNLNTHLARTYNAAGLNILTVTTWNLDTKASNRIDAYYASGDPLHAFQTIPGIPSADGNRIRLNAWGHNINALINALAKDAAIKCK
jgi:hypothetical protein